MWKLLSEIIAVGAVVGLVSARPLTGGRLAAGSTLEGIVMRAGTEAAVAGALVTLTPTGSLHGVPVTLRTRTAQRGAAPARSGSNEFLAAHSSSRISTVTGEDGRFAFKDLVPGTYQLAATADGYVGQLFGQRPLVNKGTPITVTTGQTPAPVVMRLTPTGSIAGHLREADGAPISGVPVYLCGYAFTPGGKLYIHFVEAAVLTDDRGAYRIFWATPGRYYLAAGGFANERGDGQERRAFTYFGGADPTSDPAAAQAIEILPGSELAIDWVLPARQALRIGARVVDSKTGRPPVDLEEVTVHAKTPLGYSEELDREHVDYDYDNGRLEISNVVPGTYEIRVEIGDSNTVFTTVRLTGRDVAGIVLDVAEARPGAFPPIRGRIRVSGAEKLESLEDLEVVLHPEVDPVKQEIFVEVKPDGTFLIPVGRDPDDEDWIVSGDEYRVSVSGLSPGWYVREAKLGLADVLNAASRFPDAAELEITLSAKAGQLIGVVNGIDGKPATGVGALLIPTAMRNRAELYRSALTDGSGRFNFADLTPGDYTVCASDTLRVQAFFNPEVLKQYGPQCRTVNVTESSRRTVNVTLGPAGVMP